MSPTSPPSPEPPGRRTHAAAAAPTRLFGRIAARLTRSDKDAEDAELVEHTDALGATRIADVVDRRPAVISGIVRSLTLPPKTTVPTLVADLYDGTGAMSLVWLGRREIRGVTPGVRMRVRGRVTYRKGVPTIFNPQYELLSRHVR